jgi:thiamine pyrophosphokinase
MTGRVLLICNGEPPSRRLARNLARQHKIVIAADGGANIARRNGICPNVIIGDLDSVKLSTLKAFKHVRLVHVARQDNTDLEKALDFIVKEGYVGATVIGATGKRLDFTLGNLSSIWRYATAVDLLFVGDGWHAMPVGRSRTVTARAGTTVSLIPFGPCSGITLNGLKYPLRNANMRVGDIAVSNVVRKSPFTVRVRKGNMLLIILNTPKRTRK